NICTCPFHAQLYRSILAKKSRLSPTIPGSIFRYRHIDSRIDPRGYDCANYYFDLDQCIEHRSAFSKRGSTGTGGNTLGSDTDRLAQCTLRYYGGNYSWSRSCTGRDDGSNNGDRQSTRDLTINTDAFLHNGQCYRQ